MAGEAILAIPLRHNLDWWCRSCVWRHLKNKINIRLVGRLSQIAFAEKNIPIWLPPGSVSTVWVPFWCDGTKTDSINFKRRVWKAVIATSVYLSKICGWSFQKIIFNEAWLILITRKLRCKAAGDALPKNGQSFVRFFRSSNRYKSSIVSVETRRSAG